MNYTDENIETTCPECGHRLSGRDEIYWHIRSIHPLYTEEEAKLSAQKWVESAHLENEEFEENYADMMRD